jgi:hypothetical protein
MNIWFKIAIVIAVVAVLIVLVGKFLPSNKPAEPEKTYYDVIKEDDKRLRAEPNIEAQLKFKKLEIEEEAAAQQLFEMALASRKMGRLPVLTYGQMVDYCRQIIQRFPGSEYDFKARRMLADIPEQYRDQYKITPEEIDLSKWPRQ